MLINGFELVNDDKLTRAKSALGDNASEEAIIAEYDKLGGLILRGNDKVKTGSFYDFKAKQALKEPKIVCVFNVNGKFVDVADGEETPGIVKATKILANKGKVEVEETEEEAVERENAKEVKISRRAKK